MGQPSGNPQPQPDRSVPMVAPRAPDYSVPMVAPRPAAPPPPPAPTQPYNTSFWQEDPNAPPAPPAAPAAPAPTVGDPWKSNLAAELVPQGVQPPPYTGPVDATAEYYPDSGVAGVGQFVAPGMERGNPFDLSSPGIGEVGGTAAAAGLLEPGAVEELWGQLGHLYGEDPWVTEMFQAMQIPGLTEAGIGQDFAASAIAKGGPQQSQQAYDEFRNSTPQNMDPYYENAQRKALEAVNQQAITAGNYGSSAMLDVGQEAVTNLRAQQAYDEAQYGLDRAGMGGQLAGQASQTDLASTELLGKLGLGAEEMDFNRTTAAIDAASNLQDDILNRHQTGFNAANATQAAEQRRIEGVAAITEGVQFLREKRITDAQGNLVEMGSAVFTTLLAELLGITEQELMLFLAEQDADIGVTATDSAITDKTREQLQEGLETGGAVVGAVVSGGATSAAGGAAGGIGNSAPAATTPPYVPSGAASV